jgi:serine/threonine protein kinase
MSNNQQEQSSKSNESSSINESDFAAAIQSHNSSSIEDYNVLKAIGKGKFSVVYRAIEKTSEKIVALKRIAIVDITDERQRQKTLKEVRLLQRLDHPNIIKYLDAFIDEHDLIIVFEWAEAGDLKRQLRKAREKKVRFDERLVWRYFSQICSAIQYMHNMRVMHRDLKPANIFLTAKGQVKVGDLGLSRAVS